MAIPEPGEWLTAYARVQRLADADLLRLLREASRDIKRQINAVASRRGIGAAVRAEQLRTIQRAMLRQQALIFRRLGNIIQARRAEAAARAVNLQTRIDVTLLQNAGRSVDARALQAAATRGLETQIEVAITRMTQSRVNLSQRIYRNEVWMGDRVQAKINSALARGLTAREFAAEAIDWFDPNTKGGVRYAAMRLARTEINNAFHAMAINRAAEAPWVEAMQWRLSRSHPRPDTCDVYAHGGTRGDGKYRPEDVPRKPHPHCFCYVVPVVTDEDEFLDRLVAGQYDGYINSYNRVR